MLLAMTAFLFFGICRSRDLFRFGLLIGCSALAFQLQRDNWLLALAAVDCIGRAIPQRNAESAEQTQLSKRQTLIPVAASLVLVCLAFALRIPRQREMLVSKIATRYPVRASDFIRQHQLPPPLFNPYAWQAFSCGICRNIQWRSTHAAVSIPSRKTDYFKAMRRTCRIKRFRQCGWPARCSLKSQE